MFGKFEQFIVFYEYMGIKHEIHYTKLPSFQIAFDVYDKSSKKFLDIREKHRVLRSLGFCYVPVVYAGTIDASSWESVIQDLMRRPSYYGAPLMEGVVIKNYERGIMAKAINKEFDEAIRGKEHYSRRRVVMHNKIYHGEEWEKLCYPEPITHP